MQLNLYKTEMTHRYRKQLQLPKRKEWGRNKGVWDQQIQTTICKTDEQQSMYPQGTMFNIL